MHRPSLCFLLLIQVLLSLNVQAADLVWTKTTGQYPVEAAPVPATVGGQPALIAVNRGGEVMVWGLDGADMGAAADGRVAQLAEGAWSSGAAVPPEQGGGMIACNGKGLVAALDVAFQPRWEYQLPGETAFGCATPVLLPSTPGQGPMFVLNDRSGTVTCLDWAGKPLWQTPLGSGECNNPIAVFQDREAVGILASAGTHLHRLDGAGRILWSCDLKVKVTSRAEVLSLTGMQIILCGTATAGLYALNLDGGPVWAAATGDEVGNSIVLLPRPNDRPLILCTGLWGNLYAFDGTGFPVWTHVFRSKNRGRPAVGDFNGDGRQEVLVTTYGQHAYLFDDAGYLLDDLRLSGCLNGSPLMLDGANGAAPEVLTVDASLLAHRFTMGTPKSPYGPTPAPEAVTLIWPDSNTPGADLAVRVENTRGALLCVNVRADGAEGGYRIHGRVSARSAFEVPLPGGELNAGQTGHGIIRDAQGSLIAEETWTVPTRTPEPETAPPLSAWATPAYGLFDEKRLTPCSQEGGAVRMAAVYRDEVEHGAFILASSMDTPLRVRIEVSPLKSAEGAPFAGTLSLYELLQTGARNGERAADALADLGNARTAVALPKSAAKFWLQADTRNAEPGTYTGTLRVQPLQRETPEVELAVELELLPLRIPSPLPLSVCTWDYVPNSWFPDRTKDVLDDMGRHGVTVFPRPCGFKGAVDADGRLTLDWTALDADLERLKGRGIVLFQFQEPPLEFAVAPSPERKRAIQVRALREWRDHLKAYGLGYEEYAVYPVDEPGLNYGGNNVQVLIDAATLLREADPDVRVYTDPVPGLSRTDYERLEPLVDVWCPNMRLVCGALAGDPRIAGILNSGDPVWSYECVGQVRSLSPLRYNRANAWRGDFFGLSGIGFWTHSTTQVNEWFPGKTDSDEYTLVYPGPLPVPSVRWEAVRDGLDDVAALRLLQTAADAANADPALREDALQEIRLARTDAMELSSDAFVESRDYLRPGDRRIWHTWTDTETYTRHRIRMAELTLALTPQALPPDEVHAL